MGIFRVTSKFSFQKSTVKHQNPFSDCFWAAAKFSRLPHAPPNLSATPLRFSGGCYAFAIACVQSLRSAIALQREGFADIAPTIEKVRYEESDRTLLA
ncbi:hypothetical protein QUB61_15570 [Microcoleus sp. C2D2]